MSPEALGNALARLNALLNLSSFLLLVTGFWFIKKRKVRNHRRAMMGAVLTSGFFLIFYLARFSLTGTHRFAGEGWAKTFYLGLLFSHMVLAALVVPLVLRLLYLVWTSRFHAHARLARVTYPVWVYVSLSGLLVYILLYHVSGYL